jgi:hypothetical protein
MTIIFHLPLLFSLSKAVWANDIEVVNTGLEAMGIPVDWIGHSGISSGKSDRHRFGFGGLHWPVVRSPLLNGRAVGAGRHEDRAPFFLGVGVRSFVVSRRRRDRPRQPWRTAPRRASS